MKTTKEVAAILGISTSYFNVLLKAGVVAYPAEKFGPSYVWRDADIEAARAVVQKPQRQRLSRAARLADQYINNPVPLEYLAAQEGVTRERIRQLLAEVGVSGKDSALRNQANSLSAMQAQILIQKREARCQKNYGCDLATFYRITGLKRFGRDGLLIKKFWEHKNYAQRTRIPWELTLEQYATVVAPRILEIGKSLYFARIEASKGFVEGNVHLIGAVDHGHKVNGVAIAVERQKQQTAEKARQAKAMFDSGISEREIAETLGVSKARVSNYLQIARMSA